MHQAFEREEPLFRGGDRRFGGGAAPGAARENGGTQSRRRS